MKEKAKQEKRVLLGEGEDGDEDEGDGPSPGRRMFFSPLLLSVSPPYALLFFFCYGFSPLFSLFCRLPCFLFFSPLFLSPELCVYRGHAWSSLRAWLVSG